LGGAEHGVLGGAEDAGLLGGAFDAVEGGDQIEDGGDFWVGEQIEDLASDVSPASARTSLEEENEDVALKPLIAIHGVRLPDGKGEQPAGNESCAGAATLLAKRRQWVLTPCN
jgi:hypothetical protein